MSEAPALRTLVDAELLPETTIIFGSLAAAGWLAGFATATGSNVLIAVSLLNVIGPLVGLRYIDEQARQLEATGG